MQTKTPFFTKKLGISKALTPNLQFFISKHEAQYKHGGENGEFAYFNIFEDTQVTIFSEDTEYKFVPMESFIE